LTSLTTTLTRSPGPKPWSAYALARPSRAPRVSRAYTVNMIQFASVVSGIWNVTETIAHNLLAPQLAWWALTGEGAEQLFTRRRVPRPSRGVVRALHRGSQRHKGTACLQLDLQSPEAPDEEPDSGTCA
jgi:hypothetical protein